jgi:hypothetical protein
MRNKLAAGGVAVVIGLVLATSPVVVNAAGQITSGMIKNGTIKSVDVKNNNLKGKDVKDDSLTGADVNEATLTGVNASTLNGLGPSSYQNQSYNFTLPSGAPAALKTFTLNGIPAGTYLANYTVILTGVAVGPGACYFHRSATSTVNEGYNWGPVAGSDAAASGSVVLTVTSAPPSLLCYSVGGGTVSIFPGTTYTSNVSFTRIDSATAGTVSRVGGERAAGGPGN